MLSSLKNIAVTLTLMLQTRLELIGNELQTQKLLIARQLGFGLVLLCCGFFAILLAVALAVAIWWDQRVLVLGISLAICVLAALWSFIALRRSTRVSQALLAASLHALKDDIALLQSAARSVAATPGAGPSHE